MPYLAAIAFLLALWQAAAFFLPGFLMPDVPRVLARLVRSLGDPVFQAALLRSLYRLGAGYGLAVAVGAAVGLTGGIARGLSRFVRALVTILQSIPPITWVPLLVILLRFGDRPVLVVVTLAGLYPMALAVLDATEGVDPRRVQVARLLGASRLQLLRLVYLPEVMPAWITGAQLAFGNAWRALVAAEMVAGVSSGLGWSISYAGEIADMEGVLVGITAIAALSVLADRLLLERVKRRLLRWRYA
ncbi:ABC transporter permease [Limnochorda pilosa]|uniref:ABC transporter permease n=1 Tax=Limnochorda pilosa TaxID=1555112 RepID=UPI00082EEDC8